jgi:predicted MFS family arabinose efflux permease
VSVSASVSGWACSFNFVAQLFVVDFPPRSADTIGQERVAPSIDPALTIGDFLRQPRFWAVTIAFAAMTAATVTISSHIAPMAIGWGMDPTKAAMLLTVNGVAGMAGPLIFGWLADKLGGGS